MNPVKQALAGGLLVLLLVALPGGCYVVDETEQVIVTQFGKPQGAPITTPGLKFKLPFIQEIHRIEKRALEWDGRPTEMPTKDKTYLVVDAFARWRVSEPETYFLRMRDERTAQSRLDDIIGSEIRNVVASHELIEIVRSDRERQPPAEEASPDGLGRQITWLPIRHGRNALEEQVLENAAPKLKTFGIDLLNLQFTRINYNASVQATIYQRMISERQQIAERFRSEGLGEAARILGDRERELRRIESESYRKVETLRGNADAKASEIYAGAYNRSPQAVDLYRFLKTLETWRKTLDSNTTLVLTTDSEVFRLLKDLRDGAPAPSADRAPRP